MSSFMDAEENKPGSRNSSMTKETMSPEANTASPLNGEEPVFRTGCLTIRIFSGRGLSLPPQVPLLEVIMVQSEQQPLGVLYASNLRKRSWWLPYIVIEFDKNEVLVDALGGEISAPHWLYKAHFDVSRITNVSVAAYLRTSAPTPGNEIHEMGNDMLVGRVDLTPTFDAHDVADQWYPATAGSGEFHLQILFKPRRDERITIEAFELLKFIGEGTSGEVMQVRKKDTKRIYALKTIPRAYITSLPGDTTHISVKRTPLALVNNPFIVPLKFSFQNPDKLYLVMPFVSGKELFYYLQYHLEEEGSLDQTRSRFYAAEILCALEHLHRFDFVYGGLKPENILLDHMGHVAICDFGLCNFTITDSAKTNMSCGAPEYVAPELLQKQECTKTVDWWTLGVLLHEMMTGLPPFYDEDADTMYDSILHDPLELPEDFFPDTISILASLLDRDPLKRLGAKGADEIKQHPFFHSINWNDLLSKKIRPPLNPQANINPYSVGDLDELEPM